MHQILVIDDEEFILDTVREALTMNGYEVEVAADGQEGIQKFDNRPIMTPWRVVILHSATLEPDKRYLVPRSIQPGHLA